MSLSRLVGHILIGLIFWAVLIVIERIKFPKYSNLYEKLTEVKGVTGLEETYFYYYTHSINYLSVAFLSIITLAVAYYLPLMLPSYFAIDNILVPIRKIMQILSVMLTFFGFFAYHRCHYQVGVIYKELAQ